MMRRGAVSANSATCAADIQAQQQQLRDSLRQEFETKLAQELAAQEAEREELESKLAQVCVVDRTGVS